jgi:hypothetical protein
MTAPTIQFKRGLFANLPALAAGEPGFTTDKYDYYIGIGGTQASENQFFGSGRYWTREDATNAAQLKLVDKDGTNGVSLRAPATVSTPVTYTLPDGGGTVGYYLKLGSAGVLEWASVSEGGSFTDATLTNTTLAGISTFSGAIDANSGANVAGGLTADELTVTGLSTFTGAIDSNGGLNVAGGSTLDELTVTGLSTFTGAIDSNGGLNVAGGSTLDELTVTGLSTFTGAIDSNGGLNVAGGSTLDELTVSGISTFTGAIDANGGLNVAGGSTLDELTVSGISTFTGAIDANGGLDVAGNTELDDVNVSGIITAASVVFGSGTAITSVDTDLSTVSASDNTLPSAKAVKDYVDSQVTAQDLDIAGDSGTGAIDLDSQSLTIAGTANEIVTSASGQTITVGLPDNVVIGAGLTVTTLLDVNGGADISGGATVDNLTVSGISTFTGAIDANGGADISGGETTLSSATVSDLTAGRVVLAGTSGSLEDSSNLTFGAGGLVVGANGINVTGVSTFSTDVTVGGDLTVGGNDIKASDGTTALSLTDSTGAVTAAGDLTVSGNLYVNGTTTEVNTASLKVEDRTIDLGIVNGAAPSADTTWDLGVLFNYYGGGAAKKSAVIWEHGDTRFKFASVLSSDTEGSDADTPQLTVTTFAPIEVAELWINNTCTGGSSQVIACSGDALVLQNVLIDGGTF